MNIPKGKTDEELIAYFKDYVASFQCRERHPQSACDEVEAFDKLVTYFFPNELKPQITLYDKMMDAAVEFEESGFMAGYRLCLRHLQGHEEEKNEDSTISSINEKKELKTENKASQEVGNFISSKQMAKMFVTSNFKVVRRIKNQILPYCSEEDRKGFELSSERSRQNKYIEVYHLGKRACEIYLEHMEEWTRFTGVVAGIAEFKKRMQEVFA